MARMEPRSRQIPEFAFVDNALPSSSQESTAFDVQNLDGTWVAQIKEKLLHDPRRIKVSSTNASSAIHRVPQCLLQHDENAYIPQIISIGPLHKYKYQLQAMEEHKCRYLNDIVKRKGEAFLDVCLLSVKMLEGKARRCYSEEIAYNSNSFVETMVLDGCFILELFVKTWYKRYESDPIFHLGWLNRALVIDLLKLENQLPFFILQHLFQLMKDDSFPPLEQAALYFFHDQNSYRILPPNIEIINHLHFEIHHLLHLLHTYLVLLNERDLPQSSIPESFDIQTIYNATKLEESGIEFKKRNDNMDNLLGVKFRKGVIEIPTILIEDDMNPMFRNLIAFEQCYLHCKKYITSYAYFLDCLINNGKDVEILCRKGIIKHRLSSEEEVATVFNKMGKDMNLYASSFYMRDVCKEINRYCEKAWPTLRASLKHDYFKNWWAVVSFIGALILLFLTAIQAFFSAFSKFALK